MDSPVSDPVSAEEIEGRDAVREARHLGKVLVYDRTLFRANLFVALAVFLAALAVYAFNLVPHAVPGPSADTLASALGLRGGLVTRHLVWRRALGTVLACSSPQGAVFAANAFSMVFSALGVALSVSTLNVFFRDTEHVVGLLSLAWFFLTPVMYETGLQTTALSRFAWFPARLYGLAYLNPMTGVLALYRRALLGMDLAPAGVSPAWAWLSAVSALALLAVGAAALRAGDRRFGDVL